MKRYRRTRLTESQRRPPDLLKDHLRPLLRGAIVKLVVEITKTSGKQVREQKYLALLAPATMFGMKPGLVHVSLIGKGSCILDPTKRKGVSDLSKAGFPTKLAVALLEKLNELYGE